LRFDAFQGRRVLGIGVRLRIELLDRDLAAAGLPEFRERSSTLRPYALMGRGMSLWLKYRRILTGDSSLPRTARVPSESV